MLNLPSSCLWSTLRSYTRGNGSQFLLVGGIAAYVLIVPSLSILPLLGPYNEKRVLQIGLLLLVGAVLLVSSSTRQQFLSVFRDLPRFARWGLIGVLSLGLLSAAMAPASYRALLEVSHFVLLFAAAGGVAVAVRHASAQTGWFFLGVVVISVLLYTVYFAVSYGAAIALPRFDIGKETITGFSNTRFFNQYQTWTLPLLVGAMIALPKEWRAARGSVFGLAALWWTLVLVSDVRGTVVAMAIAAGGVWLLFRGRAYRWLGAQAAVFLVGGVLYYVLFTLEGGAAPQVVERIGDVGGQSRRLLNWTKALDMAGAHPWMGVGPMHYAWPPYDFTAPAHPHNAFLQWLAEWGVPSTALMSSLTIWGGWRWMQQEKDQAETASTRSNAVRVALVASLLAGTAHAMVSGLLVMPVSQVLLVLVGGWAWGRYQHDASLPTSDVSLRAQVTLCVVLVASIGVVGSSLRDLSNAQERRSAFAEAVERNRLSPRYWTQGYLHVRDPEVIERARTDR